MQALPEKETMERQLRLLETEAQEKELTDEERELAVNGVFMAIGQIHMVNDCEMEKYPSLYKQLWSDYEIMREYKER